MPSGQAPIPPCQPGGASLVSAEYANKLIVPVNAILQGKVAPLAGVGFFSYAGGQFILDLSPLVARVAALEGVRLPPGGNTGQVLAKNSNANYDFKWIDVESNINVACCNTLQGQVDGLQDQVDGITDRLDNASISASCSDGNVTVDLNI